PSEPRELTTREVKEIVDLYRIAAENAKKAGFDGVELHSANGYLINQFISEHTNFRSDEYGGSLDNRLRFLREVTEVVSSVFGSHRVGVRIAPLFSSTDEERVYLGLVENNPHATYIRAAEVLNELEVGYLSIAEADWDNSPDMPESFRVALRETFRSPIMYSGRYTQEKAELMLEKGWGDLFGFGRPFIANPDLPERIKAGYPLNSADQSSLYGGTEKGYTDYPVYSS
ncbi:alkene reductase, partial [Rahnella perminowiae]|nr:alkene reductase [Rahnella perminowiae]